MTSPNLTVLYEAFSKTCIFIGHKEESSGGKKMLKFVWRHLWIAPTYFNLEHEEIRKVSR